uniref:Forkhead box N n=1 Tax=Schmidtea mediterranea TaxID=79327 RepID=A0A822ZXT4_SCHMD|nr:TPA_exp: forkhead box N [Schmidtea mediterranea]
MCAFDDSLTEIDWLNSLCIQKKSEIKEGNVISTTISPYSLITTHHNSPNDNCNTSRIHGYDKPSYSYAYLIKLAIESSNSKKMKLNEIYSWISETFPYYKYMQKDNNKGWKNAIRHNLSLNKIFKRCAKDSSQLGKGSFWTIDSSLDDDVQYPPVKKMKLMLNSTETVRSSSIEKLDLIHSTEITQNISKEMSIPVSIVYTLLSSSSNNEYNLIESSATPMSNISTSSLEMMPEKTQITFATLESRVLPNNSAFTVYSNEIENHNFSKEPCNDLGYSCQISYSNQPIYRNCLFKSNVSTTELNPILSTVECSREILHPKVLNKHLNSDPISSKNDLFTDKLEVDEDIMSVKSANNDFVVKTPVLSQINSQPVELGGNNSEIKEVYEENELTKGSLRDSHLISSLPQDTIDNLNSFDNLSFYDSFASIPQPLFDSESRSFELSQSTRKYLYNLSGVKENLLHRSQWLDLQEEDYQNQSLSETFFETLRSEEMRRNYKSETYPDSPNCDVSPTKEYLELKSSLISYRYKSDAANSTSMSLSTSSTEKSSNTLRSKSDIYKKSNSFDSTSEIEHFKRSISENQTCDGDEEITDVFPWDSII